MGTNRCSPQFGHLLDLFTRVPAVRLAICEKLGPGCDRLTCHSEEDLDKMGPSAPPMVQNVREGVLL